MKLIIEWFIEKPKNLQNLPKINKFHIEKIKQKKVFDELIQRMKKTISIETMKQEQNYTGTNKAMFESLADDLNIEEPIEDLLNMLK